MKRIKNYVGIIRQIKIMLHYKPAINYKTLTCKLSSISDIKVKNAAAKYFRLCKLKPTIKYFSCP